jgi:alpha-tubulin suppressor-like RCC1 family protein
MSHKNFPVSRQPGLVLALLAITGLAGCSDERTAPTAPEASAAVASATSPLSFTAVSAGASHTCGIAATQLVYCWGDNGAGELGTGTNIATSSKPVPVAGNLKFVQVSAGREFTCGITNTSFAYCWGSNDNGQLGVPFSTSPTNKPVAVDGGNRRFSQIRAGFNHTCAVTPFGAGFCWGKNQWGQLGANSTVATSTTPLRVAGGHLWDRIVAGGQFSCGIDTDHLAWCWGNDDYGQLAHTGAGRINRKPLSVRGGLHFRLIVAGGGGFDDEQNESPTAAHTCGVTTDNKAYCWGDNTYGELGAGANPGLGPVQVSGNRQWGQVIAGWTHTCGVTSAKVAFCWGTNNFGQNGNGTTNPSNVPVRVAGDLSFAAVTTGPGPELDAAFPGIHSCGITTTNRVYCWGSNDAGELGDGTTTQRLSPVAVVGP